jgi:integrase
MSAKHLAKLHKYITTDKPTKEKLSEFIKDLAYSNEATDRTISTRYSLFKKHIRNNHPEYDDEFLKNLNPPIELTKKLIEENGERRMARKMVEFDQVFIDKILALKDSAIPFETAMYLQFVSGRRINEIYDSPFRINAKDKKKINMKLSKKKEEKYFNLKLLDESVDNGTFKNMLNKLRTSVNGMDVTTFTNRVNKQVKKILGKDFSSHDLRGLYAIYSFEKENPDKFNQIAWVNKVLNHDSNSTGSSQSYTNFKFVK